MERSFCEASRDAPASSSMIGLSPARNSRTALTVTTRPEKQCRGVNEDEISGDGTAKHKRGYGLGNTPMLAEPPRSGFVQRNA